jgi:polar amino acid transport system substrate-binding protein
MNAVVLGQADAVTGDAPVILYGIEKTGGKLQTAGAMAETSFYGLGVAKNSELAKAVQAALQSMIDDGSYQAILDRWGVAAGGVGKATINAGA